MTPTDALIEKMARAIADATFATFPWDELPPYAREEYLRLARAAYSAEHEEDGNAHPAR